MPSLALTVAVLFLNEEEYLPRLLASIAAQTRLPDRLLLVDDGSEDASLQIAGAFAHGRDYVTVMPRPRRARGDDRLAAAAELRAFQWAVERAPEPFDVIAKLDGDLELTPRFFESVVGAIERNARLGIAGGPLGVADDDGRTSREPSASWHVRGATKFYRRTCWEEIAPLPAILGWDTIDEARARMRGWEVEVVPVPDGDALHMRPTGTYDGAIRGFRRRGTAAWAYGAHPLNVAVSAAKRMRQRPHVVGGFAYLHGWARAAMSGAPRAEPELLEYVRREQLRRIRGRLRVGAAR